MKTGSRFDASICLRYGYLHPEPSLGLSPLLKEVRSVIIDLRTKFSAAVLLVEQNAGLALAVAERGYLLQYGQIVASGPIAELRDHRLMHELYLGQGRSARKG